MTTRKLGLLTIGFASLLAFGLPAMAGGWSFGFGFGWGQPCYRPYFGRSYVYTNYYAPRYYAPPVVYSDPYPAVVAYPAAPVVSYYGGYYGPSVVYRSFAPRYFSRGVVVAPGYSAVRAYHAPYFAGRAYVYRGGHGRHFWR